MIKKISIGLAEDAHMVRKGIIALLAPYEDIQIVAEAPHGKELLFQIDRLTVEPKVCLLDISMPEMNGYDTLLTIKEIYPKIEVMMLSHYDDESAILRALQLGARAFLHKEEEPAILHEAICVISGGNYYQNELVTPHILYRMQHERTITLTRIELCFLKHVCSDLTYKEIADKMGVCKRTAEDYSNKLMEKLNLRSRTALVLYAIRMGLVPPSGRF
jgi:two-component system invasion response regulator UvrY